MDPIKVIVEGKLKDKQETDRNNSSKNQHTNNTEKKSNKKASFTIVHFHSSL